MAEETRAEKARRIARERIAAGESKVVQSSFEVSTKGNQLGKEFSALNATFKEGRFAGKTIEEVWQNDIKKSGKGRPPSSDSILFGKPIEESKRIYQQLWQKWANENPDKILELKKIVDQGIKLTDSFAGNPDRTVNQAEALTNVIKNTNIKIPTNIDINKIINNPSFIDGIESHTEFFMEIKNKLELQGFKEKDVDNVINKYMDEIADSPFLANEFNPNDIEEAGSFVKKNTKIKSGTSKFETIKKYDVDIVRANTDKLYIFGDNTEGWGKGGQAIIRDEPNAFGISTKNSPSEFMSDNNFEANKARIDADIEAIKTDGRPIVFPEDGIGTGRADLKNKAPRTYEYLMGEIEKLKGAADNFPLTKIISGLQKNVDQYGIEAAKALGLDYGGTVNRGFKVVPDGSNSPNFEEFKASGNWEEIDSQYYPDRTKANAQNGDGTVWFGEGDSRGYGATKREVGVKPWIENPTSIELREWIIDNDIKTLNVAGNRSYGTEELGEKAKNTIINAVENTRPQGGSLGAAMLNDPNVFTDAAMIVPDVKISKLLKNKAKLLAIDGINALDVYEIGLILGALIEPGVEKALNPIMPILFPGIDKEKIKDNKSYKEQVIENLQITSKISPTDIALDKYSEKNSSKLGMDSIVMTQLTPNIGRVPRKIKKSRYNKDYNWIEGLING